MKTGVRWTQVGLGGRQVRAWRLLTAWRLAGALPLLTSAPLQYLFPLNKLLVWAVGGSGLLAMPLGILLPCLPTPFLTVEPHRAMVLVQCPQALFDGYHFIFIF